jgi:16S rRNA pseudouridine516 synthase
MCNVLFTLLIVKDKGQQSLTSAKRSIPALRGRTPAHSASQLAARRGDGPRKAAANLTPSPETSLYMPRVRLSQVLFSQGFGTRRECDALLRAGRVAVAGTERPAPDAEVETDGLLFTVDGVAWPYHARALIALHKPAGYECSQRPSHHPTVMSLLPAPLRTRGVQPVGRLDADTTGLLLLTDDGALLHRLTSPKRHVPKVYIARCAEPVTPAQLQHLRDGVALKDDPQPARAQQADLLDATTLVLTLTEGRYHQVKRMVAAAGNHVAALHRQRFGALELPPDLAPGAWCFLPGPQAVLGA